MAEDPAIGATTPCLETRHLGKSFPGVAALANVSFAVARGEVHALVGQNGAGKSTLVNILSGIIAPDRGLVLVHGRPVTIDSPRQALALGIATVHQELSMLANLTVAQNIALGREPRRHGLLAIDRMRANATAALARIGLGVSLDAKIGALGLAERQLVEIAKALSCNPAALILDEPTAPLAHAEAARLFDIIAALKAEGIAIIFVSHRFREILDHCDQATVLRGGVKVATTALDGWTEERLTDAILGAPGARYRKPAGGRRLGAPVLAATHLRYRAAVRDASFTIHAGEIVALVGLLGAGQNEIARLIGGDLVSEDGELRLHGRPRRFATPRMAIAQGICLLTDDRKIEGLALNLPLGQNIALPSLSRRQMAGVLVAAITERLVLREIIKRFGIVARSLDAPMRTLSGGNQQKSLMARWQLAEQQIFVLMEPTRGVDVGARSDIYRKLDALPAEGKTAIVVMSDLQEALDVAERILVVRDGRVVAERQAAETDEAELSVLVQGAA